VLVPYAFSASSNTLSTIVGEGRYTHWKKVIHIFELYIVAKVIHMCQTVFKAAKSCIKTIKIVRSVKIKVFYCFYATFSSFEHRLAHVYNFCLKSISTIIGM
jgi:hypothetical protein